MPGIAHPAVQVLLLSMLPMQHAAADLRPDVIFRAAILKIPNRVVSVVRWIPLIHLATFLGRMGQR